MTAQLLSGAVVADDGRVGHLAGRLRQIASAVPPTIERPASASTAISHAGNVDPSSVSSTGAFVGPAESVGSGRAVAVGSGVGSCAVVGSAVAVGSGTWVEPVVGVGPAVEVGSAVGAKVGVGSGAGVAVGSGVGMAVGSGTWVETPSLGGFTGSSVYETRA